MRVTLYSGLAVAMIAADNAKATRARQEAETHLTQTSSNNLIDNVTALAESDSALNSDIEVAATTYTGSEIESSKKAGSESDSD